MPTLYILAGPNGAGKTTFYHTAVKEGFIPKSVPFLNIDIITKDELGGYTEVNFARAEELYRERVGRLVANGEDFMIESNLAKDSEYEWIVKMKKRGYDVALYYLCTDYPDEVHLMRVQERVAEGGHNVPAPIVHHRYKMSLLYLQMKLDLFTEAYLIDNEETARVMAIVKNGEVVSKKEELPNWARKAITILEKLQKRRK